MSEDPTVIGLVTQGLAEVKEAVNALSRDLHNTLARLPNEYVPRREVERRFDELTIDLGAERVARETALREITDAREADRERHAADRKWALGVLVTVLIALLGYGITFVTHWS